VLQARKAVIPQRQAAPQKEICAPVRRTRSCFPGKRAVLLLISCACFVLGLLVIVQYSCMISLQREIHRAEVTLAGLGEECRAMELEAAKLASLGRIESVARVELGMREPDHGQLKVLTASQEDGDR
jgi:cell division protein FtsL